MRLLPRDAARADQHRPHALAFAFGADRDKHDLFAVDVDDAEGAADECNNDNVQFQHRTIAAIESVWRAHVSIGRHPFVVIAIHCASTIAFANLVRFIAA